MRLLSDLANSCTADVASILDREGWSLIVTPPCHDTGCPLVDQWQVGLVDGRTRCEAMAHSSSFRNALILAEGKLLREIETWGSTPCTDRWRSAVCPRRAPDLT